MSYNGPVTIVLDDGAEIEAQGRFRAGQSGHLKSWSGEITSDDFADLTRVHGAREIRLRLPDGSEARALVASMNVSIGGSGGGALLAVTGTGPPPF